MGNKSSSSRILGTSTLTGGREYLDCCRGVSRRLRLWETLIGVSRNSCHLPIFSLVLPPRPAAPIVLSGVLIAKISSCPFFNSFCDSLKISISRFASASSFCTLFCSGDCRFLTKSWIKVSRLRISFCICVI